MRSRKAAVIFGIIVALLAVRPWFVKAQRPEPPKDPATQPEARPYPVRTAACPKCDRAAQRYERAREQFDDLVTLAHAGARTAKGSSGVFVAEAAKLLDQLRAAQRSLDTCNKSCVAEHSAKYVPARCAECEDLAQAYQLALNALDKAATAAKDWADAEVVAAEAQANAAWKALEACEKEKCKKPLGVGYGAAGAIGAGAAILTGVAVSGGGSNPPAATATAPAPAAPTPGTSSSTSTSSTTTTTTTTVPGITPATDFNGVYIGGGEVGTNECAFGATATVQGTMAVDSAGRGVWTKIHTNAGVMFVFQIMLRTTGPNTAEWTSTTSQFIGLFGYQVTDTGTISGRVMTIRQNLVRQGTPACTVTYNLTLNRQ